MELSMVIQKVKLIQEQLSLHLFDIMIEETHLLIKSA